MSKEIIRIDRNTTLEIDTSDMHTPALVVIKKDREEFTASWDCATQAGDVDGIAISDWQIAELMKHEDKVNDAYSIARKDCPEYQ